MRREVHTVLWIVIVLVHDLGEAKVGDLYVAAYAAVAQEDVTRLEVVVNHWRLDLVEILECRHHLCYDGSKTTEQ